MVFNKIKSFFSGEKSENPERSTPNQGAEFEKIDQVYKSKDGKRIVLTIINAYTGNDYLEMDENVVKRIQNYAQIATSPDFKKHTEGVKKVKILVICLEKEPSKKLKGIKEIRLKKKGDTYDVKIGNAIKNSDFTLPVLVVTEKEKGDLSNFLNT